MINADANEHLLRQQSMQAFFQEILDEVISRQAISPSHETTLYISELLAGFSHSTQLFTQSETGADLKPLALMYADAVEASTEAERDRALRHLADVALFISGLFPQSLSRSLVDVDYYINMGGSAYGFLAQSSLISQRIGTYKQVFHELSSYFAQFVDVLAELADNTSLRNDGDVLRLYEIWLCSGSKNAMRKLNKLGIRPLDVSRKTH